MDNRFYVALNPMWGWYHIVDNESGKIWEVKVYSYEDAVERARFLNGPDPDGQGVTT